VKNPIAFIAGILALGSAIAGCSGGSASSKPPYLTLTSSTTSIGVGLSTPVSLKAEVDEDAAGEACLYKASAGSFSLGEALTSSQSTVDSDGKAIAQWFPPTEPGIVKIRAMVKTVAGEIELTISPVASITISGLPDYVLPASSTLFTINVPMDWANKALEVCAPLAILDAAGPVSGNLDKASRIEPIADQLGKASVILIAPSSAQQIPVTVSLFGTSASKLVSVSP
jgi:hypothetical protein